MSNTEPTDRIAIAQSYRGSSRMDEAGIALATDLQRSPVRVHGRVKEPLPLREALSVLYEIVQSDMSYKPKDRSAQIAYQRQRKASAGLSALSAQREYFDWLARNDPMAWFILDPVVSVCPDAVLFEVFSKDEGCYAQLKIDKSALEVSGEWVCGTTNVDFSSALNDGVQRMRSYREMTLSIGPQAVTLSPQEGDQVVEKRIALPESWVRGFLQVQSAANLLRARIDLSPITLYNLLRHLRMHADQKRQGRAIRVELVPGERPRLVLEPWEQVLETERVYDGERPEVVRIWGRRRWSMLRRLLPYVTGAELHVMGSGLPSFLVVRAGAITLTLGLTGFTAANWSKTLQFDMLLPRPGQTVDKTQTAILKALKEPYVLTQSQLLKATGADRTELLAGLQALCQKGLVMVDLASQAFRLRPLLHEPPDPERLRYRNQAERVAWDLLASKAVKLNTEEKVHGQGTRLVATVSVKADKREYRTSFSLDEESRVRQAKCSCAHHLAHGTKQGPCPHLLALRLRYAELQSVRAKRRSTRGAIQIETRTYTRRGADGESITQLSLNKSKLRIRWGLRGRDLRVQSLLFDDVESARADYYERIGDLENRGYLDASA